MADKVKTLHKTLLTFIKGPFIDFSLKTGLFDGTGEIITEEDYKIQADEVTQKLKKGIAEVIKDIGFVLRRDLTAIETVILCFKETVSLVVPEMFAHQTPPLRMGDVINPRPSGGGLSFLSSINSVLLVSIRGYIFVLSSVLTKDIRPSKFLRH